MSGAKYIYLFDNRFKVYPTAFQAEIMKTRLNLVNKHVTEIANRFYVLMSLKEFDRYQKNKRAIDDGVAEVFDRV